MNYIILYLLLIGSLFCDPIVTIKKTTYIENDFYKEYGKKEWDDADSYRKQELIDDFINRRLATLEATEIGLHNQPDITKKLYDRNQIALVNITYEELVAKPLISNATLNKTRKYIIEERLLHHILIGHESSRTQNPNSRTIDGAFLLAQKISKELNNGADFIDYAIKYSEDQTVFQNKGKLDWISWGRTVPAFQEEAFVLKKGGYSRPVLTDFGYHVIFCEDIRPSEYATLNHASLDEIVYAVSRNSISNQLNEEAKKYDNAQFEKYNLKYNNESLNLILKEIQKQTSQNKVSGQYKIDLIDLFNDMTGVGVVTMFDNNGYGIKWFAERLKMIPSSRHPQIVDLKSLKQAFNIIVLQYLAIKEGYANNVHQTSAYKKQKEQLYQSLLYDQYLRWLVNNASDPDSLTIIKYYEENKDLKYSEGQKVAIKEIKVLNKDLADSLLLELKYGADFISIAKQYSKTNPLSGGSLTPFTEGKYNQMGEIAFSLKIGEISGVISNLDRTYSIVLLEKRVAPGYIPVNKVYNRIESILKRDNQKAAKTTGLIKLRDKYNVIINKGVYSDK